MKTPFVTKDQLEAICQQYPTPFHLYDEAGIRQTAREVNQAFAWNPGFREHFAVKATSDPRHPQGARKKKAAVWTAPR